MAAALPQRAAKDQLRPADEAFPWDTVPGFLIRDNDGAYGEVFARRLRAMGIRDRPIAPRSPWQNGYVERSIGSIRRECLDHVIMRRASRLAYDLERPCQFRDGSASHCNMRCMPSGLAEDVP